MNVAKAIHLETSLTLSPLYSSLGRSGEGVHQVFKRTRRWTLSDYKFGKSNEWQRLERIHLPRVRLEAGERKFLWLIYEDEMNWMKDSCHWYTKTKWTEWKPMFVETNWLLNVTVKFTQIVQVLIDVTNIRWRALTSRTAGARRRHWRKTTWCGPLPSGLQTTMKQIKEVLELAKHDDKRMI